MASAVIRYGGGSDEGSKRLRGQIRKTLADTEFNKVGNASWKAQEVPLASICDVLERVVSHVGSSPAGSFEQLWFTVSAS